ncbi:MAG TPA: carbonate dehydratase [Rhodanobacteraceae bacterium]|jgi:carbonic anhydrase|nr:carbonate dehydratase [Rhodanobacteraceae bacterium]
MLSPAEVLQRNREWSAAICAQDTTFFKRLSRQQTPKYLWIGCSDSRVPANQIMGVDPGEVFVHRNISNLVLHSDMNCLSVMQFAVEVLKVEHIVITGHYGCGGVQAALEGKRLGLIDNWLRYIGDTLERHQGMLDAVAPALRHDRLCELNVIEQVANAAHTTIVRDAWDRGQQLTVHGWCYGLADGLLHDLGMDVAQFESLESRYHSALHKLAPVT